MKLITPRKLADWQAAKADSEAAWRWSVALSLYCGVMVVLSIVAAVNLPNP